MTKTIFTAPPTKGRNRGRKAPKFTDVPQTSSADMRNELVARAAKRARFVLVAVSGVIVAGLSGVQSYRFVAPEGHVVVTPAAPAAALPVGVLLVAAGSISELWRRRSGRARAERFRDRWWEAWARRTGVPPMVRRVRWAHGRVAADVILPPSMTWDELGGALDIDGGAVPSELRLGKFEWPVLVTVTGKHARRRELTVVYELQRSPRAGQIPTPAQIGVRRLAVGVKIGGDPGVLSDWVTVDLDVHAHISITGAQGRGKGRMLRAFKHQWVARGWPVILIDGGNSAEHDDLAGYRAGRLLRLPFDPAAQGDALVGIVDTLNGVGEVLDRRQLLCAGHRVDRWADLPAGVKAAEPPLVVAVDELWTLLQAADDAGVKDDVEGAVTRLLRLGRKFGVQVTVANQVTHASSMNRGAMTQMTFFVALGNLPSEQQRMVGASAGWARVPDGPGHGVSGVMGDPDVTLMVGADLERSDLEAAIVAASGSSVPVSAGTGDDEEQI